MNGGDYASSDRCALAGTLFVTPAEYTNPLEPAVDGPFVLVAGNLPCSPRAQVPGFRIRTAYHPRAGAESKDLETGTHREPAYVATRKTALITSSDGRLEFCIRDLGRVTNASVRH